MNTPVLFPEYLKPRRAPRRLLRMGDAGEIGILLVCDRCGYNHGWHNAVTNAEYRAGVPCPDCNSDDPDRRRAALDGSMKAAREANRKAAYDASIAEIGGWLADMSKVTA